MDVRGKKAVKLSGKPFKSTLKENTIKDIIDHPALEGKKAYVFYEDDSFVRVEQCKVILDSESRKQIRFVDNGYNLLFEIPDGEKIVIKHPNGDEFVLKCEYIDESHTKVGGNVYHICEFAEKMKRGDISYIPENSSSVI